MGLQKYRGAVCSLLALLGLTACSNPPPPPPVKAATHEPQVETPTRFEATTPYRAKLATKNADLYLPPWFSPRKGGYDLVVHFHGLGKLQEANVERAQLNVAVVSVNLGAGSDAYANGFRDPGTFPKLLAEAEEEIEKSGRGHGAHVRRLALSAWSAGFLSVARVMSDPQMAEKVDAILLADGFFTSFTNVKKRTPNTEPLEKFVKYVEAAEKNDRLFAITHTTIPTGEYPSVQEVVAKLLEMTSLEKAPSSATGPRNMHEIYTVDRGSFHVRGYEGVTAQDHIKQIHAMGETLYPYLKTRWDDEPKTAATR